MALGTGREVQHTSLHDTRCALLPPNACNIGIAVGPTAPRSTSCSTGLLFSCNQCTEIPSCTLRHLLVRSGTCCSCCCMRVLAGPGFLSCGGARLQPCPLSYTVRCSGEVLPCTVNNAMGCCLVLNLLELLTTAGGGLGAAWCWSSAGNHVTHILLPLQSVVPCSAGTEQHRLWGSGRHNIFEGSGAPLHA